jgi:hypothetical protein
VQKGTVERALELARSGEYLHLDDLKRRLRQEQHESVEMHLSSASLKKQLRTLMAAGRAS